MAKRRKAAARKSRKAATRKSSKFSTEDQVTALVIAVVIVIALAALYLYQNAKPKTAQIEMLPAVTTILPA